MGSGGEGSGALASGRSEGGGGLSKPRPGGSRRPVWESSRPDSVTGGSDASAASQDGQISPSPGSLSSFGAVGGAIGAPSP